MKEARKEESAHWSAERAAYGAALPRPEGGRGPRARSHSTKTDTVEFWNDVWATMDHTFADHDLLLPELAEGLQPGRALDLGCGSGGNAVWLAGRGWRVTAVDFSEVAIEKGRGRASESGVEVEFLVSDVTTYRPDRRYDLIISFYIQLWPEQRSEMLAEAAKALNPGGRLIFVSHDESAPPEGWSREDLASLTTPLQVSAELPGLKIERADVVEESGAHAGNTGGSTASEFPHDHGEDGNRVQGATTVVVAVKEA